ncbi:hypothetical protein MED222_14220 [Vibrio sp. MED222]|nr:hypothetical protein MED222_14220 [Vibrio sp. MED222]
MSESELETALAYRKFDKPETKKSVADILYH